MLDATQPARLGNVYDALAYAMTQVTSIHKEARALLISPEGEVSMIDTGHSGYGELVTSPGFVGFLTDTTDPARLSRRLQDAHKRVLTQ